MAYANNRSEAMHADADIYITNHDAVKELPVPGVVLEEVRYDHHRRVDGLQHHTASQTGQGKLH